MADMRKEFPSQTENRRQWILDVVRANQQKVWLILHSLDKNVDGQIEAEIAKFFLADMPRMDRDALLQSGGILTDEQIELLK